MKVASIELVTFRSFLNSGRIELDNINILIGANNAGKSSVLRGLSLMQVGGNHGLPDVRIGYSNAKIAISFTDIHGRGVWDNAVKAGAKTLNITINSTDRKSGATQLQLTHTNGAIENVNQIPNVEPTHFVVPYLSKRKVVSYNEDVRNQYAMQIGPDLTFLAAKLARISNPSFPGHDRYRETSIAILGFMVTAIPGDVGLRPGIYLPDKSTLPIDQMGEGVPHIVALLADLALSEDKLFLIEEPENDLHPSALKALLDLILESSERNQFVISTHSNIVLRHLGGASGSKVYNITAEPNRLPIEAKIEAVDPSPQSRLRVLRDLGYTFSDFDVWDGWLILEESSAERIIRDYLIPWFAPKLSRIRTLAVGGISEVEPTFNDFQRLVRFTHLEQAYTNAAWVRVDGDTTGKIIVEKLRNSYLSWESDRFANFSSEQFEHYYPSEFSDKIAAALAVRDKQSRRDAKRTLLNEVRAWLDADTERGKAALLTSAKEIIDDLQRIETQLLDGA